jgi:hypothetical protein
MINKCDIKNTNTHRTRPIPLKLAQILDLVNSLPPEADRWLGVQNDRMTRLAIGASRIEEDFRRAFESFIVQLPAELQMFICSDYAPTNPSAYEEAKKRYFYIIDIRDFLRNIAKNNAEMWTKYKSYDERLMLAYWQARGIVNISSTITIINWSLDKGRLNARLPSWIEDLREIEVIRIRECPICKRIFWAGRLDKSACSLKKCGQVWRQRLSRKAWDTHGEQYKRARKKKKEKSATGNHIKSNRQKGD